MERKTKILLGLFLIFLGASMSVVGLTVYTYPPGPYAPLFALCPVGGLVFLLGGVLFLTARQGNVP